MRAIFFDNSVAERGSTKATVSYARAFQNLRGYEVAIAYRPNSPLNNSQVISQLRDTFRLMPIDDIASLERLIEREGIDFCYLHKQGSFDTWTPRSCPTLVHAVFQYFEPHGTRYAFISEWLADKVGRSPYRRSVGTLRALQRRDAEGAYRAAFETAKWVPLIVEPLQTDRDLRGQLRISHDSFVIGTLSAPTEFNIPFVRETLPKILDDHPEITLLMPNTQPFFHHPRALFLPTIVGEASKASYLATLDIMLHARSRGESFGMAICEALSCGIPVVSWQGGIDRHHAHLLKDTGWLYQDSNTLKEVIETRRDFAGLESSRARDLVCQFLPQNVVEIFENVFLS